MIKVMMAELKPGDQYPDTSTRAADLEKQLESVKWNLWHGNVPYALQRIDDLEMLEEGSPNKKKLEKAVREFHTYVVAAPTFIPNHGDRQRHDETISTAFVESTVTIRDQPALREEISDAPDPARSASAAANPRAVPERRSAEKLCSLVSGNESRSSRCEGGRMEAPACRMERHPFPSYITRGNIRRMAWIHRRQPKFVLRFMGKGLARICPNSSR